MKKTIIAILTITCMLFAADSEITTHIKMVKQSKLKYRVAVEEAKIKGHTYLIFQSRLAAQAMSVIHAEHCQCKLVK